MIKTDELGEYDEFEVPIEFTCPIKLDRDNNAIACAEGGILGIYTVHSEQVVRNWQRRRAEFLIKLANGEIVLDRGRVLKRTGEQWDGERLVVTYLMNGDMPENVKVYPNETKDKPEIGIVEKVVQSVRKRGRPRKNVG